MRRKNGQDLTSITVSEGLSNEFRLAHRPGLGRIRAMLSQFHVFEHGIVWGLFLIAAVTTLNGAAYSSEPAFPEADQLPVQTEWPNPLATFEGKSVATKKLWLKTRRPELKNLFQHYMYGAMPPAPKLAATVEREDKSFFGGKATMKEVTLALGPPQAPRIHLLMVVPNNRRKAAP